MAATANNGHNKPIASANGRISTTDESMDCVGIQAAIAVVITDTIKYIVSIS